MTKSQSRKEFDLWLEANYQELVKTARGIHRDPCDLVHHTYLRIIKLRGVNLEKVLIRPEGYFRRAMFIEATRGEFKKEYILLEAPQVEIQTPKNDLKHAFLLENFELATDRLSWFDRTILKLYCDGWNLTQIARESGINPSTFHTSLHRSREKLKVHFSDYYVK